jgi:hypothetical protein
MFMDFEKGTARPANCEKENMTDCGGFGKGGFATDIDAILSGVGDGGNASDKKTMTASSSSRSVQGSGYGSGFGGSGGGDPDLRKRGKKANAPSPPPPQREQAEGQAGRANRPQGQVLDAIIDRYEKLLEQCAVKKTDRCADVMYTLGNLYYDQANELAQTRQISPDYSKSIQMYRTLIREYPNFHKLPEARKTLSRMESL